MKQAKKEQYLQARGRGISGNEICPTTIKRVGGFERKSESSFGMNVN